MNSWGYGDERCKHGRDIYFCPECEAERKRKVHQEQHEESVRRQNAKLKILTTKELAENDSE